MTLTAVVFGIFGLGIMEVLIVVAVFLVLFSPKLPGIGRYVGKSISELRRGLSHGSGDDADKDAGTPTDSSGHSGP